MQVLILILLGLAVGLLAGLMGIGGGVILVPGLAYLARMDQHVAQGTSLMVLLPPLGLGALMQYWNRGTVDLRAGIACALGFLLGGFGGGLVAVGLSSRSLQISFGAFMIFSAGMLWRQGVRHPKKSTPDG